MLCGLSLLFAVQPVGAAAADDVKPTIVYINGEKYYVHIVSAGETLYSISRLYGADVADILEHNPSAADGLRVDATIKIPVAAAEVRSEDKRRRRDYEMHTVTAGETLYAISRKYSVAVGTLMEDNPDIDPANLAPGSRLYVRKAAMGTAHETQTRSEWERYRDNLNAVAPDGYIYYIVCPGDTLYSLSRRFNTAQETIISLNNLTDGLRAGDIIKLPETRSVPEVKGDENRLPAGDKPSFRSLPAHRPVRIALMLPLTRNGAVNANFTDFYRGFLLGLEHLKESGISASVTLMDTEQNPETVAGLVAGELSSFHPDVIIGPVYENLLPPVVEYAEAHNIPVVSPLASLSSTDSGTVFQLSPDAGGKYDKVAELFDGSRDITLVYGQSVDKEFEQDIRGLLAGKHYSTRRYAYEHQSEVERREKERARMGLSSGEMSGPSDLTGMLRGSGKKVFVIMSDNETEVDRIMASIASADISLKTRERSVSDYVVLGNPKWYRFSNLDRSVFFTNRVVLITSYYANRGNDRVALFDDRYISEFDAVPTPYSYRGYDAAVMFGEGMYGDISSGMLGRRYAPLQTGYTFGPSRNGLRTVNGEWVRINYRDNYTIEVE